MYYHTYIQCPQKIVGLKITTCGMEARKEGTLEYKMKEEVQEKGKEEEQESLRGVQMF